MVPFILGKALTILPLEAKNSVLDGKPTSCIFLVCLFNVYESVMPCQSCCFAKSLMLSAMYFSQMAI